MLIYSSLWNVLYPQIKNISHAVRHALYADTQTSVYLVVCGSIVSGKEQKIDTQNFNILPERKEKLIHAVFWFIYSFHFFRRRGDMFELFSSWRGFVLMQSESLLELGVEHWREHPSPFSVFVMTGDIIRFSVCEAIWAAFTDKYGSVVSENYLLTSVCMGSIPSQSDVTCSNVNIKHVLPCAHGFVLFF